MNKIIKLILKYKKTKDDYIFEEIVEIFNPLIKVKCNKVIKSNDLQFFKKDKEEIKQDLLAKLFSTIEHFNYKKYYNNLDIEKLKNNKHFINFIKANPNINNDKLIDEFNLFCNENQFKKYLNKTFNNEILKNIKILNSNINIVSLNNVNKEEIEIINTILETNKTISYDLFKLTKKEKDFLQLFIENNNVLTIQEVSKKLNITKQAVSKRKKIILKKIIKS